MEHRNDRRGDRRGDEANRVCETLGRVNTAPFFFGTGQGDYAPAQAAYLGHFAERDPWEAASGVKKLENSLRASGRPVIFYAYPGTSHWFFEKDRPEAYRATAARLAWQPSMKSLALELEQ